MPRTIRTLFIVEGRGRFPIDMLRHDACWPYTGTDAAAIEQESGRRKVTLITDGPSYPTEGRWASFLWPVITREV